MVSGTLERFKAVVVARFLDIVSQDLVFVLSQFSSFILKGDPALLEEALAYFFAIMRFHRVFAFCLCQARLYRWLDFRLVTGKASILTTLRARKRWLLLIFCKDASLSRLLHSLLKVGLVLESIEVRGLFDFNIHGLRLCRAGHFRNF